MAGEGAVVKIPPRAAIAVVIAGVLALAGCNLGDNQSSTEPGGQRAIPAELPFTVTEELGAPVIRRSSEALTVELDMGRGDSGLGVTPLPDGRFVLKSETRLALVGEDGRGPVIDLPDCESVIGTGNRVLALCDHPEGVERRFLVRVFDPALQEKDGIGLRHVHERSVFAPGAWAGTRLVAAGDDTFWVTYADQGGFSRGGTWLLAKHDLAGRLLATTRLDGRIYNSAVSPDGRHLALLVGNSDACANRRNLRVVDLGRMALLNTAPDVPGAAAIEARAPSDVFFQGRSLSWTGSNTVVAEGVTPRSSNADCDTGRQWRRTFDVRTPGVSDREVAQDPSPVVAWVGPNCGDGFLSDTPGSVILRVAGQTTPQQDTRVLHGASVPRECFND